MNVRIAAETLSSDVAGSMEYLMNQNYSKFRNAEATIGFIRRINNIFDILNTKNVNTASKNIFKDPPNLKNIDHVLPCFGECTKYIKSLEVVNNSSKRVRVTKSAWKCGNKGFIIDMQNTQNMYNDSLLMNTLTLIVP